MVVCLNAPLLSPLLPPPRLTGSDMSVQVRLNDYLDIYCPHYPEEEEEDFPRGPQEPEVLALYLVAEKDFRGCVESKRAIKRWECNSPHAPFGPVRFSEKIQRFTPSPWASSSYPGTTTTTAVSTALHMGFYVCVGMCVRVCMCFCCKFQWDHSI